VSGYKIEPDLRLPLQQPITTEEPPVPVSLPTPEIAQPVKITRSGRTSKPPCSETQPLSFTILLEEVLLSLVSQKSVAKNMADFHVC
jgi:hypothetical protein